MTTIENGTPSTLALQSVAPGIWAAPGARIIDRTGRKMLPIGRDGFVPAAQESVVVDKTMLIADVLDSGYTVTLFCRPRRFGKTLNMTMSCHPRPILTPAILLHFLKARKYGMPTAVGTANTKGRILWCISASTP